MGCKHGIEGACTKCQQEAAQDDAYVCGRTDEAKRWDEAVRKTWKLIDPMRPAGVPGSYARCFDVGVETALRTLRENLGPNSN